jgi:NitT/TauT family transport system permease protein
LLPGSSLLQLLVVPAILIGIWEAAGQLGLLPAGILPWPSLAARGWYVWAFGEPGLGLNPYSGTWFSNVYHSTMRVAQGYALAIALAVPIGTLIGWSPGFARIVDPTLQALRPVPITAWLPFSIALFGITNLGAVSLIALGAFYPIVVNSTHGARDVSKNLVRAALMLGATRMQLFLRVVLPSALPAIFTGLRLGIGVAWTAVIIAEMVAVKSGLGYVLWDAYYVGRMDIVIVDMVSIGLLGFLSDRIIVLLESRLLSWKRLQRA